MDRERLLMKKIKIREKNKKIMSSKSDLKSKQSCTPHTEKLNGLS